MPRINGDNSDVPRRKRPNGRVRRSIDISLVEDLQSDSGKNLHTKDGQVGIEFND